MNIKLDIPDSFFQGEERCGYYVSPEMKRVWAVQLDLLNEFAHVCEKHNLRWYIDAGTLLGAVRHKGFIPWDHDADVMMMRSEYDRLCSIAPKEFHTPYVLNTPENCSDAIMFSTLKNESTTMLMAFERYAKDIGFPIKRQTGISLDIFPVDKIPDDERSLKNLVNKIRRKINLAGKIAGYTSNYLPSPVAWKRMLKALIHSIVKHTNLNYKTLLEDSIALAKSYNQSDSRHAAKLCMVGMPKFIERRVWNLSDFDGVTYLPFEMLTLPAPSGWENILTKFYGDWHKFVIRETNGVPEPEAFFYDTEHPYTYYTQKEKQIDNE